MKIIFLTLITFLISHFAISQELYLKTGKNYTTYNYKNSYGQPLSGLQSSNGSNYEFGCEFFIDGSDSSLESIFSYSASIILNQFNAKAGNMNNSYEWKTNYLGIQNAILVSIISSYESYYCLKVKAGINTSTILSGQQLINNNVYDLKKHEEFKGIILQPLVGLDFRLEINRELMFNFGYSFSKAFNISNKSAEKLSFSTNQIQFGINYTLY